MKAFTEIKIFKIANLKLTPRIKVGLVNPINNGSANYFTNRFPITWGGISIIGELFPCSLSCPNAIKYSKTMHSDVINFGFNEIAKVMVEHALKPIYINEENGSISTIFKEGTDIIKFS